MRIIVTTGALALTIAGLAPAAGATAASAAASSSAAVSSSRPGSRIWLASETDTAADGVHGHVVVSPNGSTVYVAGGSDESVSAYNATTGATLWTVSNPGADSTYGTMALSPDGSTLYVTASDESTGADYETVAYNATTGATVWTATATSPTADPTGIAVSPDGSRVYVTGMMETKSGRPSYYSTVAYDAMTGAKVWAARYDGPTGQSSFPFIAVSPNGSSLFLAGTTVGRAGKAEYATLALNAGTGATLWTRFYPAPMGAEPTAVTMSPDGASVFVTGTVIAAIKPVRYDVETIAYNAATGARRWASELAETPTTSYVSTAITVNPASSLVYVTGLVDSDDIMSYLTVAYNTATGATSWSARYNPGPAAPGAGVNQANAVTVSPNGATVYVTGQVQAKHSDYATVAYGASTGARLWASLYQGGTVLQPVRGLSVAVSPDSSTVFVTGFAETRMVTLAYTG
jgi:WD40 repeat protein